MAAFTWGSGGAQEDVATRSRRRVAESLLEKGTSTGPIQHWSQGLNRVAQALLAGRMLYDENQREQRLETQSRDDLLSHPALQGGATSYGGTAPVTSEGVPKSVATAPVGGDTDPAKWKIYTNDEPSPLDPPSGADRDMAVRTVLAEAGNQPPVGQLAVANVIRKRAINGGFGGDTIPAVVTAKNQFEPWNTQGGRARMASIDPNSPQYRLAAALVDQAYTGTADPTNGATHFYAPKAQAALGRPAPRWDDGTGQDIGDHRFFGGATDAGALPPNAQLAQGQTSQVAPSAPAAPAAPQMPPAVADYVRRLIRNPATRAAGVQMLQQYSKPTEPDLKVIGQGPDGPQYGWVDQRTRSVTPYTAPAAPLPADSVVPPAPPGVDPKIWRKEFSERRTREGMPASFEDTSKLRNEVQGLPSYKNLAQAAPVYRSMLDAAGRDNRAADVNLIYGMAKVMDPGSVVRESEMTVAQAVATLPAQLRATVESQLTSTGRLTPDVRAAIMQEARSRVLAYQGMFDQDAHFYRGVTGRNRMNAEDVIPSFGEFAEWAPSTTAPAAAAPAAGVPGTAPVAPPVPPGRFIWDPQKGLTPK